VGTNIGRIRGSDQSAGLARVQVSIVAVLREITFRTSIWLQMSVQQRRDTFAAAGWDDDLFTFDEVGVETTRFWQMAPVTGDSAVPVLSLQETTAGLQAGDDLRDIPLGQSVSLSEDLIGDNPVTDEFGAPIAGAALVIAGRALRLILGGGGGRLTAAIWGALPNLVKTVLIQAGIGIGAMVAFNGDIPFITLPGQGGDIDTAQEGLGGSMETFHRPVDIQIGSHFAHGATIIGSWNTNKKNPAEGVTFYRLSNGWLAVQKKNGSWKTWKPKKPIVLYADGATDLKTLLRADKAVTKQVKKLANMINRRAPSRKKAAPAPHEAIVIDVKR